MQIQRYLGFRLATPLDLYALQTWLEERALEHDKPMLLLQLACDQLHHDRIVRPGLTRLERLIATARQQAHLETFRRLTPLLTEAQRAMLDQTASKFSLRIWLDKPTVSGHRNSVKLQTLTVSLGEPYPAAMRPGGVEPTEAHTIALIIHQRNGNFGAVCAGQPPGARL